MKHHVQTHMNLQSTQDHIVTGKSLLRLKMKDKSTEAGLAFITCNKINLGSIAQDDKITN